MSQYFSPGVYVEELPSGVQPIAGVGTSTAGFIGRFTALFSGQATPDKKEQTLTLTDWQTGYKLVQVENVQIDGQPQDLAGPPTSPDSSGVLTLKLKAKAPPGARTISFTYVYGNNPGPKLCTSFSEFTKTFGDLANQYLAHAVYGFFDNGGSRCYVVLVSGPDEIPRALEAFELIDEIALVAAPGLLDAATCNALAAHCERLGDRFALLDGPESLEDGTGEFDPTKLTGRALPQDSTYAAYYCPWIGVFDPAEKKAHPDGDGTVYVPPSGHLAGVYARVDAARGVHKAPANEVIRGALGLKYRISRAVQDGLNPQGINLIRELNGAIRVWGARTLGGDRNGEWKYVNVRRLLLYIEESIDEGTQWVVFEPNDPGLWAKITRNVTAFLTNVWRSGALLGNKPEEAFYVKCDAETNPPEVRDLGQVVTEVGVAAVRPAEFVIFRISQWAGASK